jgi:TP901 family phage tail tape measure protein
MADLSLRVLLEGVDRLTAPLRNAMRGADSLRDAIQQTAGRVREMEQTSARLTRFAAMRDQALSNARAFAENRESLRAAREALERVERESGRGSEAYKNLTRVVGRLEGEQGRLSATAERLRGGMGQLRAQLTEAGIDTRDLAGAQSRLRGEIDEANAAMRRQADRMRALQAARSRLDASMQRSAAMAGAGAAGLATGGGLLAMGARMAAPGLAFDAAMSRVVAVGRMDKASAAVQALREQAKKLGQETSYSATEAAEGMSFLAMAGFKANDILAAMPSTLALAKAGGADLATTADIASNILSGFGLEASQMNKVADTLAATFTRSNVDLAMLGETMKYVAPVARQAGMSLEEAAAMAGLLGNVGIQASMAGTATRAMLTRIASNDSAIAALKDLGIGAKDADNNLRALPEILADVARATEGKGSAERLSIFKDIAGEEAGAAFAELVAKGGAGEIGKFVQVINQAGGEVQETARAMADNAAGDLEILGSALAGLNIELMETTDAPLRDLIKSLTEAVAGITVWVKENPKLASTLLQVAAGVAALIAVGGAVAITIAGLIGPFAMARYAMTTLGIRAGVTGASLGRLRALAATAARGIGTGLRAAATRGAAGLRMLAAGAVTAARGIGTGLRAAATRGAAGLRMLAAGAVTAGGRLRVLAAMSFARIGTGLRAAGAMGASGLAMLTGGIRAMGVAAMSNPIVWIIAAIIAAVAALVAVFYYWDEITAYLKGLWAKWKEPIMKIWDWFKETFAWTPLVLIVENWDSIKDYFSELWAGIKETVGAAWDWIMDKLSPLKDAMGAIGRAWDGLFGGGEGDADTQAEGDEAPSEPRGGRRRRVAPAVVSAAALAAAPAIAAEPGVEVIPTAPGAQAAANHTTIEGDRTMEVAITINAAPGQDEEAIARQVKRALDAEMKKLNGPRRGRMHD